MLDLPNLIGCQLRIILTASMPILFKTTMDAMEDEDSYLVHSRNAPLIVLMKDVCKLHVVYQKLQYLLGKYGGVKFHLNSLSIFFIFFLFYFTLSTDVKLSVHLTKEYLKYLILIAFVQLNDKSHCIIRR